jgi:hypothetical protein
MFSEPLLPAHNPCWYSRANAYRGKLLGTVLLSFVALTAVLTANAATSPVGSGQSAEASVDADAKDSKIVVSGTLPGAEVGVSYLATISVSGGTSPYTFSVEKGTLPAGLSISRAHGTISGTPTKAQTASFSVRVEDSKSKMGAHSFTTTVAAAPAVVVSVTPDSATVASGGSTQFSAAVSNTSNAAVTWKASAGTISGAGLYTGPTVGVSTAATITATSVADSKKSDTASVTINAPPPNPVVLTTTSLSVATAGTSYSDSLTASGGKTPYSWSVSAGGLPSGITLPTTGMLSGTTTQTGQFSFTVQVTDSASPQQTASGPFTLTVNAATVGGTTITSSFFGADFNGAKVWPPTDGLSTTGTLGGLRLWDSGVKWGQLNTDSGVYNWTGLDAWLDRAASSNQDVLYTFGDTPQFAAAPTAPGPCLQPGAYSCATPTDVNSDGTGTDAMFQAFVTALVTHAAGRISFYELWNEPDCNCFWSGTQAQLVRMGKDAAAIIRSLDPSAKILSPSAHGPTMKTWFDGYIAAGGAPNFDIVNVHMRGTSVTNGTPEAFLTVYGQVQTELEKTNLTALPLWDDEHGILQNQGLTDPDMLAGYTATSLILRAGVGIQRQYIYTWDSHSPYGMQGNASGTAWDQVAIWLIGHSVSPCVATGTIYTCAMDNGQVVWDSSQTCSKGICSTSNYTYPSTYKSYKDILGNKITLSGSTVAVGCKPIMLENQ